MAKLTVHADQPSHRISRHIYGHFAEHLGRCIYDGLYVGVDSPIPNTRGFRRDIVDALCQIHIPNLRWPGGCFADTYHWMDGIGPQEKRPSIVNVHWGGTTENNACGTHEFFDLCAQLGCEPYVCGNVGSGTVREMAEWLEYITMAGQSPMSSLRRANGRADAWHLKYFAVGNENWGCGGNMTADYYSNEFRRYASYARNFTPGEKLYKVACGFDDAWNETLLKQAGKHLDGVSIHYYTLPTGKWDRKGASLGFPLGEWFSTLKNALGVEGFIKSTSKILDAHDPEKRIGIVLDEWGTWFDVEPGTNPGFLYQQNSLRDALVAAVSFNIFHAHADRVHMANIAQTVNVLQAMILTEGPKMLLTPTYHVFNMFKVHQDATLLPTTVDTPTYALEANPTDTLPQISASASRDANNKIHVSLANLHHDQPIELTLDLPGASFNILTGTLLTAPALDTHNTFDAPNTLAPAPFTEFTRNKSDITVKLPAKSVVTLELA